MKKIIFITAMLLFLYSNTVFSDDNTGENNSNIDENTNTEEKVIEKEGLYAVIKTNLGDITCQLFFDKAPVTVANMVGLAEGKKEFTDSKTNQKVKQPYYDGIIFHRVIKGFVIQAGCPLGTGTGGPGYSFNDEFSDDLKHDSTGILSMANAGPNTNGSQFFITLTKTPHLDGRHTVFGKVVAGMDVVDKIANVEVGKNDKPLKDVVINTIEIKRIGDKAKNFDAIKVFDEYEKNLAVETEKKFQKLLSDLKVKESKFKKTDSGLKYYILQKGKGNKPVKEATINAHYTLYLEDGRKIDSSYDRNQTIDIQVGVGKLIPGWDESLLDMKKGEKRIVIIPPELGYGKYGYPPYIPPNARLVFIIELVDIK